MSAAQKTSVNTAIEPASGALCCRLTDHAPSLPALNQPGYGHICFQVDDIHAVVGAVVAAGGARVGEVTDLGTPEAPVFCVYVRDPEGNVVELEQCRCLTCGSQTPALCRAQPG